MKTKLLFAAMARSMACAQDAGPKFEVASIKPNHSGSGRFGIAIEPGGRFVANNASVKSLITFSYQLKENQLSGLPAWAESERFDVTAKPESGAGTSTDELRARVRALLAERFALSMHKETKELPIYVLVIAKNGPKLAPSKGNADLDSPPPGGRGPGKRQMFRGGRGEISGQNVQISSIADQLSSILGRTVVDKTGLAGDYDFTLKYTPDMPQAQPGFGNPQDSTAAPPADPSAPSIFVAVQEQIGLKLEPQKGPVDVYVVDRVEKPSEN